MPEKKTVPIASGRFSVRIKEELKLIKNMEEKIRKLYRSRDSRIIAGVCGGLAEHLGIDPLLVRLFFVLLIFANGIGLFLYLILFLLVPPESK